MMSARWNNSEVRSCFSNRLDILRIVVSRSRRSPANSALTSCSFESSCDLLARSRVSIAEIRSSSCTAIASSSDGSQSSSIDADCSPASSTLRSALDHDARFLSAAIPEAKATKPSPRAVGTMFGRAPVCTLAKVVESPSSVVAFTLVASFSTSGLTLCTSVRLAMTPPIAVPATAATGMYSKFLRVPATDSRAALSRSSATSVRRSNAHIAFSEVSVTNEAPDMASTDKPVGPTLSTIPASILPTRAMPGRCSHAENVVPLPLRQPQSATY
mmetsp:Transcript_18906/g.31659  ORF Transcript_18906/g.31659 Transcript_18906/m.31659 type:complete len:272 (+) Transcript_18906:505-1320(+)